MMSRIALPGTRYLDGYLAAMKGLGLRPPVPPMEAAAPSVGLEVVHRLDHHRGPAGPGRPSRFDHRAERQQRDRGDQRADPAGIRIPRDLAVITYDDELAELCEIPLTAVSPPKRLVGTQAAELLLDRIADARARAGDPSYPAETSRHLGLVPDLVLRRSTP